MFKQFTSRSEIPSSSALNTYVNDTSHLHLGVMSIAIPMTLVCGILLHRRYRTAMLKRQIQKLEKLWLLNSTETHG